MRSQGRADIRRERLIVPFTLAAVIILSCSCLCHGHGRLLDPPSRATMWRLGFDSPADYDDHQGYCGGKDSLWRRFGGRCGVCGDAYYPIPRAHERGGRYYRGTPTKTYTSGSWITATVGITANHRGWLEFRVCAYDEPKEGDLEYDSEGNFVEVTQRCLNRHVLKLEDGDTRFYLPEPYSAGEYEVRVRLPRGITCKKCLFQWKWNVGNSWGTNPDGESCVGCGEQEQFYACADIVIKPRDGRSAPRKKPGTRRRQKGNRKGQRNRGSKEEDNEGRTWPGNKNVDDDRTEDTTTSVAKTTKKDITDDETYWWFVQHVPLVFNNTDKVETKTEASVGTLHPKYVVIATSTASINSQGSGTIQNASTNLWERGKMPTIITEDRNTNQNVSPSFWKWVSSFNPLFTKSSLKSQNEHKVLSLHKEITSEKVNDLPTVRQNLTQDVNSSSTSSRQELTGEAEMFHTWWRRLSARLNKVFLQGLFGDTASSSNVEKEGKIADSLKTDSDFSKHRSRRHGEIFKADIDDSKFVHVAKSLVNGEHLNTTFTAAADEFASVGVKNNDSFHSLYDRNNNSLNTPLAVHGDVNDKEHKFTANDLNAPARVTRNTSIPMFHNAHLHLSESSRVSDFTSSGSLQDNFNTSIAELANSSLLVRALSTSPQQSKRILRKRFAEPSVIFSQPTLPNLVITDSLTAGDRTETSPSTEASTINLRDAIQVQTTSSLSVPSTNLATNALGKTHYTEAPNRFSQVDLIYPSGDFQRQPKNTNNSHILEASQTSTQTGQLYLNSPFSELTQTQIPDTSLETGAKNVSSDESNFRMLTSQQRIDLPLVRHEYAGLSVAKHLDSDRDFNTSREEQHSKFLWVSQIATSSTTQSLPVTVHYTWVNITASDLSEHHRNNNLHSMGSEPAKDNQENILRLFPGFNQANNISMTSRTVTRNVISSHLNKTLTLDGVNNGSRSEPQIKETNLSLSSVNAKEEITRREITIERSLNSSPDNTTISNENKTNRDRQSEDEPNNANITNQLLTSGNNITLANIDLFVQPGETNTEAYNNHLLTQFPQSVISEKRLLLHGRIARLLASLKGTTDKLDSNKVFVNTRDHSFTDGNSVRESANNQLDEPRHGASENRENGAVAKEGNLGGPSEKYSGVQGKIDPTENAGGSDGADADTGGSTDSLTGRESGQGTTETGLKHGKNNHQGWSDTGGSKYVNSEEIYGPVSGKPEDSGSYKNARGTSSEVFDMRKIQVVQGENNDYQSALSKQESNIEDSSGESNTAYDHRGGHAGGRGGGHISGYVGRERGGRGGGHGVGYSGKHLGREGVAYVGRQEGRRGVGHVGRQEGGQGGGHGFANSFDYSEEDQREAYYGGAEDNGVFVEGKERHNTHSKVNTEAFTNPQEHNNHNRVDIGEKIRELKSKVTASEYENEEFAIGGNQGQTVETSLDNGKVRHKWGLHTDRTFNMRHFGDDNIRSNKEEPRTPHLLANNDKRHDIIDVGRDLYHGTTRKTEEADFKRSQQNDNVQDKDNRKYKDMKEEEGEEESDPIYWGPGEEAHAVHGETLEKNSRRVKRSMDQNKDSGHKGGEDEEGGHKGGEHEEDGHKGGEHEEGSHKGDDKGGEHEEGGHKGDDKGDEHEEEGHKGDEHEDGGHKGGEHEESRHKGGEHEEGGHKGGEHEEGGHKGGEHEEGGHKGGEHEESGHKGGEHEEGLHEGPEHEEGGHKGGENEEGGHKGGEHEIVERMKDEHEEGEERQHEMGEHNKGQQGGGEHEELSHDGDEHEGDIHEGGEHKEDEHEGDKHNEKEQDESEHEEGVHKEGKNEEGKHAEKDAHRGDEHKEEHDHEVDGHEDGDEHDEKGHGEDEHEESEHKESQHEEHKEVGEHNADEHKEDEHEEGGHQGSKHKKCGHKGGKHKKCGHKGGKHEDYKHEDNEHEKGTHEGSDHHQSEHEDGGHEDESHEEVDEHKESTHKRSEHDENDHGKVYKKCGHGSHKHGEGGETHVKIVHVHEHEKDSGHDEKSSNNDHDTDKYSDDGKYDDGHDNDEENEHDDFYKEIEHEGKHSIDDSSHEQEEGKHSMDASSHEHMSDVHEEHGHDQCKEKAHDESEHSMHESSHEHDEGEHSMHESGHEHDEGEHSTDEHIGHVHEEHDHDQCKEKGHDESEHSKHKSSHEHDEDDHSTGEHMSDVHEEHGHDDFEEEGHDENEHSMHESSHEHDEDEHSMDEHMSDVHDERAHDDCEEGRDKTEHSMHESSHEHDEDEHSMHESGHEHDDGDHSTDEHIGHVHEEHGHDDCEEEGHDESEHSMHESSHEHDEDDHSTDEHMSDVHEEHGHDDCEEEGHDESEHSMHESSHEHDEDEHSMDEHMSDVHEEHAHDDCEEEGHDETEHSMHESGHEHDEGDHSTDEHIAHVHEEHGHDDCEEEGHKDEEHDESEHSVHESSHEQISDVHKEHGHDDCEEEGHEDEEHDESEHSVHESSHEHDESEHSMDKHMSDVHEAHGHDDCEEEGHDESEHSMHESSHEHDESEHSMHESGHEHDEGDYSTDEHMSDVHEEHAHDDCEEEGHDETEHSMHESSHEHDLGEHSMHESGHEHDKDEHSTDEHISHVHEAHGHDDCEEEGHDESEHSMHESSHKHDEGEHSMHESSHEHDEDEHSTDEHMSDVHEGHEHDEQDKKVNAVENHETHGTDDHGDVHKSCGHEKGGVEENIGEHNEGHEEKDGDEEIEHEEDTHAKGEHENHIDEEHEEDKTGHEDNDEDGQDEQDDEDHGHVHHGCKHSPIKTDDDHDKEEEMEKGHEDDEQEKDDEKSSDHHDDHEHENNESETGHDDGSDVETEHDQHGGEDEGHFEEKDSLKENGDEEDDTDFEDYFNNDNESGHDADHTEHQHQTSSSDKTDKKNENRNEHGSKDTDWEFHNAQTYGRFGHGGK